MCIYEKESEKMKKPFYISEKLLIRKVYKKDRELLSILIF
jgi:hypothetical protein